MIFKPSATSVDFWKSTISHKRSKNLKRLPLGQTKAQSIGNGVDVLKAHFSPPSIAKRVGWPSSARRWRRAGGVRVRPIWFPSQLA